MARKMAPSQHPHARKTHMRSKILRRNVKGRLGVHGSSAMAKWAPMWRPEMQRATVMMITANKAMKEYPPFRWTVDFGEVTEA